VRTKPSLASQAETAALGNPAGALSLAKAPRWSTVPLWMILMLSLFLRNALTHR
jgi:hypothetical protein